MLKSRLSLQITHCAAAFLLEPLCSKWSIVRVGYAKPLNRGELLFLSANQEVIYSSELLRVPRSLVSTENRTSFALFVLYILGYRYNCAQGCR